MSVKKKYKETERSVNLYITVFSPSINVSDFLFKLMCLIHLPQYMFRFIISVQNHTIGTSSTLCCKESDHSECVLKVDGVLRENIHFYCKI